MTKLLKRFGGIKIVGPWTTNMRDHKHTKPSLKASNTVS